MSTIAKTLQEAQNATGEIRAGGTDYMERRRHHVTKGDLVDISTLPDLDRIDNGSIGALVSIERVAQHDSLRGSYPGLAMAAGSLATPQIRHAASMGGALLQRTRCWYYRHEGISCFKKGGTSCPARTGNHQFGVCFDLGPCVYPHPSTLGMALMAYDAAVEIFGKGRRTVAELYGDGTNARQDHLLGAGEILTKIHLPQPLPNEKAGYFRSISRARAEWPLVEVLVRYQMLLGKIAQASVAIGGVANVPLLLPAVAEFLNGKTPGSQVFKEAGKIAARGANPLPMTQYKVELVQGTVFETLRRADAGIWGGEG